MPKCIALNELTRDHFACSKFLKIEDNNTLIVQVEMQSDQLEEIREKWRTAQEYNKENDKRFDLLER